MRKYWVNRRGISYVFESNNAAQLLELLPLSFFIARVIIILQDFMKAGRANGE